MSGVQGMPAAYEPLRENDHVKLDGRDAVVMWASPGGPLAGQVIVQVMVEPGELTWIGRER